MYRTQIYIIKSTNKRLNTFLTAFDEYINYLFIYLF